MGDFFWAKKATCLKLLCSDREPGPFRDLNAKVARVPDEGKGAGTGTSEAVQGQTRPDSVSAAKDLGFYLKSHGKSLTCL